MKKLFSISLILTILLGFVACSHEEDDIFSKSAAERLNEISDIYSQRLTDSKGGWVMEYYPYTDNEDTLTGRGYLIMNKFLSNGSVYTLMKNNASHNQKVEDTSAWQIITDMGPVLTYNTYNKCYGRFTDPTDIDLTPSKYDDESGKGFQGDYEFVMVDVPEGGEHIMLKGKKRGVYQRLTRVPEGTDFEAYLDDIYKFQNKIFFNSKWEILIIDNGVRYSMDRQHTGRPTVYPEGKDSTAYGWYAPYLITKHDDKYYFRFKDTVMVEGKQMEQEFVYDEAEDMFHGIVNSENILRGPIPNLFFNLHMTRSRWQYTRGLPISGEFTTAFNTMLSSFLALTWEIENVQFTKNGKDMKVLINLKVRNTDDERATFGYIYDINTTESGVSITYREPDNGINPKSQERYDAMPALANFINTITGNYQITPATGSKFDMRSITATSEKGSIQLQLN